MDRRIIKIIDAAAPPDAPTDPGCGFVHAAFEGPQAEAIILKRFAGMARRYVVDTSRLAAYGIVLRVEANPGKSEVFPHFYGIAGPISSLPWALLTPA